VSYVAWSLCGALKENVCVYEHFPLTLKHIAMTFGTEATRLLHIGALVSYSGTAQPNLEPVEQSVLVVGKRRRHQGRF